MTPRGEHITDTEVEADPRLTSTASPLVVSGPLAWLLHNRLEHPSGSWPLRSRLHGPKKRDPLNLEYISVTTGVLWRGAPRGKAAGPFTHRMHRGDSETHTDTKPSYVRHHLLHVTRVEWEPCPATLLRENTGC